MRKILCIILSISCFFSLIACSNKSDSNNKTSNAPEEKIGLITDYETFKTEMTKRINLSKYTFTQESPSATLNSYKYKLDKEQKLKPAKSNFKVKIDGTEITLPITIDDLLKKGFDITEINFEPVYYLDLESNLSFGSLNVVTKKGNDFLAYAINPGENYQGKMKDCLVTQLDVSFYENGLDFETDRAPLVPEIKFFKNITKDSSLDDIIKELGYPSLIDYSTAEYNGEITLSAMQLRYNFSNKEYDGYVYITLETFKNQTGVKKNLIFSIAYAIEFPAE
jgi:hypothetical protein